MVTHRDSHGRRKNIHRRPYAMVGAGRLVSTLWKTGDQQTGWRYQFNVFRITRRGQVGQLFSPDDVIDVIKLARVLAATLAEDGCLPTVQRRQLKRLATMLDDIISPKD